jgi:hypothetical protein
LHHDRYSCPTLRPGEGALIELELVRGDAVVRVIPVEETPVTLGRELGNRVVLEDVQVSGHHAVVQRGPDGPVVRDLGSTNGTYVNDERIDGSRVLRHKDELRIGDVRLRVRVVGPQESGDLVVRDLVAGTVHLVVGDRLHVGSGEGCHVRLPSGPERAATLVVHPDGEACLTTADGEDVPVALGDTFEVEGNTFRLELVPDTKTTPTASPMRETRYPYVLTVSLAGVPGGVAEIVDTSTGNRCEIRSEPRVALLFQLARQVQADREGGVLRALAGWCHDEDLMIGIWGREGLTGAGSRYSVLLHRVRKDLEACGFDPLCLEKRRGATRILVESVKLA